MCAGVRKLGFIQVKSNRPGDELINFLFVLYLPGAGIMSGNLFPFSQQGRCDDQTLLCNRYTRVGYLLE
jgi:hypothetical protein